MRTGKNKNDHIMDEAYLFLVVKALTTVDDLNARRMMVNSRSNLDDDA